MSTPVPNDHDEMISATWAFVEWFGIPDSPVRRVLFELAAIVAIPDTEELAVASAGYLALTKEFTAQYTPKSPLQQQLESARAHRELSELLGVTLPEPRGDSFTLENRPETPAELGEQLGYEDDGRAVRHVLRAKFVDHPRHTTWSPLTREQINYVRAHLPAR
jgi:hypothetical protein